MHGRGILALEDAVTPVDCTGHFRLDETNVLIAARSAVKFRFSPAAATASNAQSIVSLAGFPLPFHNHAGWGTSSPENQMLTKYRIGAILIVTVSATCFVFL